MNKDILFIQFIADGKENKNYHRKEHKQTFRKGGDDSLKGSANELGLTKYYMMILWERTIVVVRIGQRREEKAKRKRKKGK